MTGGIRECRCLRQQNPGFFKPIRRIGFRPAASNLPPGNAFGKNRYEHAFPGSPACFTICRRGYLRETIHSATGRPKGPIRFCSNESGLCCAMASEPQDAGAAAVARFPEGAAEERRHSVLRWRLRRHGIAHSGAGDGTSKRSGPAWSGPVRFVCLPYAIFHHRGLCSALCAMLWVLPARRRVKLPFSANAAAAARGVPRTGAERTLCSQALSL